MVFQVVLMPSFLVFKYQSRNEPSPLRETEVGCMNVLFPPHPSPPHAITNTCGAAAETAGKGGKTEEGEREVGFISTPSSFPDSQ